MKDCFFYEKKDAEMAKKISGTFEWAVANANCVVGCEHNCRYCYQRYNMVRCWKNMTDEEWKVPVINWDRVRQKRQKVNGTIMFPTAHDILPETLDACIECLKNLLEPGNDVLIVSKPHLECTQKLCKELAEYKDHILFRFTVGAMDDSILEYWEPDAPNFQERLASLIHAFRSGFKTSISAEPLLDSAHVTELVNALRDFVTDSIWLGMLNHIDQRVPIENDEDQRQVDLIKAGQTEERVREIYEEFKDDPIIKWKNSYKEILGLELADEPGLDV